MIRKEFLVGRFCYRRFNNPADYRRVWAKWLEESPRLSWLKEQGINPEFQMPEKPGITLYNVSLNEDIALLYMLKFSNAPEIIV